MQEYQYIERQATIAEYQYLRRAVDWDEVDPGAAEISIKNSLYWICVLYKEEIIGCGRVIGDGGLCFYIQDIIVLPAYQGQGLGKRIMEHIMIYVQVNKRKGGFVGLMAAKGKTDFYRRYGFMARPTEIYGPGMILFW